MHIFSKRMLRPNTQPEALSTDGETFTYVDALVVPQGPNYALAKRMQHWRAMLAHSKGCIVSSNIAPSTKTVSVVKNRSFALAYEGVPFFKPVRHARTHRNSRTGADSRALARAKRWRCLSKRRRTPS